MDENDSRASFSALSLSRLDKFDADVASLSPHFWVVSVSHSVTRFVSAL